MKSFIGEGTGVEPADNRQLPSRLRAPGSGQACRKTLGFALIPNCELKFGPAHNAPGTWRHKGVDATPRPHPPASTVPPPARRRPVSGAAGLPGASVPTGVSSSNLQGPGRTETWPFCPSRGGWACVAGGSVPGRIVGWDLLERER